MFVRHELIYPIMVANGIETITGLYPEFILFRDYHGCIYVEKKYGLRGLYATPQHT